MTRRELREQIFLLLFRVEFVDPSDMPEQMQMFLEDEETMRMFLENEEKPVSEEDSAYISEKYERIMGRLSQIDEALGEKAENWDIKRMGKVELTILRLALYEMLYDEDVPVGVAINEAVELAKKFGQESSGSFVNAVLAKFA